MMKTKWSYCTMSGTRAFWGVWGDEADHFKCAIVSYDLQTVELCSWKDRPCNIFFRRSHTTNILIQNASLFSMFRTPMLWFLQCWVKTTVCCVSVEFRSVLFCQISCDWERLFRMVYDFFVGSLWLIWGAMSCELIPCAGRDYIMITITSIEGASK